MAKKTGRKIFSQATKEEIVAAMSIGNIPQKEIAKKYGCSIAALQLWKKALKNAPTKHDGDKPTKNNSHDEPETPKAPVCPAKPQDSAHEIMRKFWNKNYRGVDMLLTPQSVESDEVIKLVNEAIQFATDSK